MMLAHDQLRMIQESLVKHGRLTAVESLGMKRQTTNRLKDQGIVSVEQLRDLADVWSCPFHALPGIGPTAHNEITEALERRTVAIQVNPGGVAV